VLLVPHKPQYLKETYRLRIYSSHIFLSWLPRVMLSQNSSQHIKMDEAHRLTLQSNPLRLLTSPSLFFISFLLLDHRFTQEPRHTTPLITSWLASLRGCFVVNRCCFRQPPHCHQSRTAPPLTDDIPTDKQGRLLWCNSSYYILVLSLRRRRRRRRRRRDDDTTLYLLLAYYYYYYYYY
jgi:hypothetical protein